MIIPSVMWVAMYYGGLMRASPCITVHTGSEEASGRGNK